MMTVSGYTTIPDSTDLTVQEEKHVTARHHLWKIFLDICWIGSTAFGLYMLSFYVRSVVSNKMYAWDELNPGMYHEDRPDANVGFAVHLVCGCYLMLMGPLQFVPSLRRKYLKFHRWNGRIVALCSALTSLGAMYYVAAVGSTTKRLYNEKVEWSNWFFGLATLFVSIQLVRHAAFTKNINLHKLYAYRLAGIALGNIFGRLYLLVMFLILGQDATAEDMKGAVTFLGLILTAPFILIADEIWRREQRQEVVVPSVVFLVVTALVVAAYVVLLGLQIIFAWVPFMGMDLDDDANSSN